MSLTEFNLDTCLIEFPVKQEKESWTIRDAVEGVQIFGGIGSGKTSGSGRMLALKYLAAGFGGLVLTVKPDEKEVWEEYCRMTGRENDLIVVTPGGKNTFNFLEYESASINEQKSSAANIVQVLKTVIRASEEKAGGKSDDPFWETALDMLISNIIDLCLLAYGTVSVQLLYEIAQSVPRKDRVESGEQKSKNAFDKAFIAAVANVTKQIAIYESGLSRVEREKLYENESYDAELCNIIADARTIKFVDQFFTESFMNLSEKTRSIIDFSFSGFLFSLLREPIFSLFCRYPSTFTPDDCLEGKIILIDLPVKLHHKVGRDSQILFKYVWQRAMEKRRVKENSRPVFLWADEAQNFLHEYDPEYQATARSSRIATVYISQNLPNYHANMGGAKSEYRVKSFLGTLGTKIFHANADIETNRYASELIGDGMFEQTSETATAAGQFSSSQTTSVKFERILRPEKFTHLKTGSPQNNFIVEGYMHFQGMSQKNGLSHIKALFNQKYNPP
jgi:hypothetical protein